MREKIVKYKVSTVIIGLYVLAMCVDIILRLVNGVSFLDVLIGNNPTVGTYSFVFFRKSQFVGGDYWRILTWPFFAKGLIHYVIGILGMGLTLIKLEGYIGKVKMLTSYILLTYVPFFAIWFSYCDRYNDFSLDVGFISMCTVQFAMGGLLISLYIIDRIKESPKERLLTYLIIGSLLARFIHDTALGFDYYGIFYSYSFGILAALIVRYTHQNTFTSKDVKLEKTKIKQYPFTVTVFVLSLCAFILNSIIVSPELLEEAFEGSWFNYMLTGGDYGPVASWLLCHTDKIKSGQVWRLFTHVFSHMGLIHMLTNMPVLLFAGKIVEKRLGSLKMAIIYLGSALWVSSLVIITGGSTTTMGGSSLALYALMAAYLMITFEKDNRIKVRWYEMTYVIVYYILGNIPTTGTFGEMHCASLMFGVVVIGFLSTKESWWQQPQ